MGLACFHWKEDSHWKVESYGQYDIIFAGLEVFL